LPSHDISRPPESGSVRRSNVRAGRREPLQAHREKKSRPPELKDLVELRYFAGLTVAEVSELSGKSARGVERDWEKTRLLLHQYL